MPIRAQSLLLKRAGKIRGATMASGTSNELKVRVIGIGAAKVSADAAQIALIEEYLRRQW
jgi:hypothetical protein